MVTISIYPGPQQFAATVSFVANHVDSGDSLDVHMNEVSPWLWVETANSDAIIAELKRTGVRYSVG